MADESNADAVDATLARQFRDAVQAQLLRVITFFEPKVGLWLVAHALLGVTMDVLADLVTRHTRYRDEMVGYLDTLRQQIPPAGRVSSPNPMDQPTITVNPAAIPAALVAVLQDAAATGADHLVAVALLEVLSATLSRVASAHDETVRAGVLDAVDAVTMNVATAGMPVQ